MVNSQWFLKLKSMFKFTPIRLMTYSLCLCFCLCSCNNKAIDMKKEVKIYSLQNSGGMKADITNYGGRIVRLFVPCQGGNTCDVVLGFDNVEDYFRENHQTDFGAAIGRYANRLGQGRITIDGKTIQLPQNNGPHCLHGGPTGWQYQIFDVESVTDSSIVLTLSSPDGDNNFPGKVVAKGHLHAHGRQQFRHSVRGHHRQDHGHQHDQPQLLQP